MKLHIVSVYDSKANGFHAPFHVRVEALAVRWFQTQLLDRATDFGKFPEDFTLMSLGIFDDATGEHLPWEAPKSIVTGIVALSNARMERDKAGL